MSEPPSPGQLVHTDFPYTAFLKGCPITGSNRDLVRKRSEGDQTHLLQQGVWDAAVLMLLGTFPLHEDERAS